MLGEATITVDGGDLAGVTGLFWKHVDLSLATLYLPKTPLTLTSNGTGTAGIVIVRATDGPLIVHHRKQTFKLAQRDVILLPADVSSEMVLPEGGRFDCAHLPQAAVAPLKNVLDRLLFRQFDSQCLPLQLLTNYAGYLLQQEHQDKNDATMMVAHFYSLLPVLAQQVDVSSSLLDVPQNRVDSIKALIERNLSDGSFSITDVAKAEGISTRAVQKILSRAGTTFSRYVLERRLVLAKTMILGDTSSKPISQMVYSAGFNDLSYFNRTFRNRYGLRPTDLRRMNEKNTET
ncbi:transcriptional regulator [Rhizobium sp. Leaf311]|uniref:AraC family transcriptional regulator n=1 Tax=Rhizobium sp. Leaf311 TaxID=1736332 RepID=UPI0007140B4E|nr:AraC family transcriptional regulator [Rhizobium sp. Leaf311]KQQ55375.1 transcriptional regulator [Rhizobium sp. Leaf311]